MSENNSKKRINYQEEFNKLNTYTMSDFMTKYRDLLIYSSKLESLIKKKILEERENNLNPKQEPKIDLRKNIVIKKNEYKMILDSIEQKNKTSFEVLEKLKQIKKDYNDVIEKNNNLVTENNLLKTKLQLKIEEEKKYLLNHEKLSSIIDQKLNNIIDNRSNTFEPTVEVKLAKKSQDTNDIESLKKTLLKLNELFQKEKKYSESLENKIKVLENDLNSNSQIDEANLEMMKELAAILKTSNYDEDLIKRLQQQIKKNKQLNEEIKLLKRNKITTKDKLKKNPKSETSSNGDETTNNKKLISFMRDFLPLIDLYRKSIPSNDDNVSSSFSNWIIGFNMLYKKFEETIVQNGVEIIAPKKGDKFNHDFHESIGLEDEPGYQKDQILELIDYGFKYNEILLKPAKVKTQK